MDAPAWMAQFDGTALASRVRVSAILATSAADGWAHVAYLSCGEILATPPSRIALLLWPTSTTARNLEVTGKAGLHVACEDAVWETRLSATRMLADEKALMIEAEIVDTIHHKAPYAKVSTMIGFELNDELETVKRWREQIARLRTFAGLA